jgi:aquaporin Z
MFWAVQCCAAYGAGFVATILLEDAEGADIHEHHLGIGKDHSVYGAFAAEFAFSFLLCFVVLSTATTKSIHGNSFFGAAIGFTVSVGMYCAGPVSGAAFNPAVGVFLPLSRDEFDIEIHAVYIAGPMVGALVAAGVFRITNPSEFEEVTAIVGVNWAALYSEFLGTFYLSLTVACAKANDASNTPIAIGMILAIMTYASSHISTSTGAQFNPAVTLSMVLRGKLAVEKAAGYIAVQVAAAYIAGNASTLILEDTAAGHASVPTDRSLLGASIAETLYSFALCYVVLSVTTVWETEGNQFFGMATGLVVSVGAFSAGPVSGAAFNPAVATGLGLVAAQTVAIPHGTAVYVIMPFVGAVLAVLLFKLTNKPAYSHKQITERSGLLSGGLFWRNSV